MANGLASCGWVEYWQPDVALGSLKGMINGIDYEVSGVITVVSYPAFPSGKSLRTADTNYPEIQTPTNPLLEGWGETDFFCVQWGQLPSPVDVALVNFYVGESNHDGFSCYPSNGGFLELVNTIYADMTASDGSFQSVQSPNPGPYTPGVPHCLMVWWTSADKTLHLQMDGGTEYTQSFALGPGDPDPTNTAQLTMNASSTDFVFFSDCGVCKAPIPDADQRALLFGGLPFDQWDSGEVTRYPIGPAPWVQAHGGMIFTP